jgi:ribonuclease P protein component
LARFIFRKEQRIRSEADFQRVMKHKRSVSKGFMRLYMAPNTAGRPRFGISIGRTCGKAHIRNRLKRLGREAFRLCQHEIPADFDYVLIFTPKMSKTKAESDRDLKKVTFQEIRDRFLEMIHLLAAGQKP